MDERMEKSSMDAEKAALLNMPPCSAARWRSRPRLHSRLDDHGVTHNTNAMRQAVRDRREAKTTDNL